MENKADNNKITIEDDYINYKNRNQNIFERDKLGYSTDNSKENPYGRDDGINTYFVHYEGKYPQEYNISRNIEDISPNTTSITINNTNENQYLSKPIQNSYNNLFSYEKKSFSNNTNIVSNSPNRLGMHFTHSISLVINNQQPDDISNSKKNETSKSSSKVIKKRRTRNIKIPVSDEYLKQYCFNAVLDFPKYGIKKKCHICFNEYDMNELFKDNRVCDVEINYICLYCSIKVDKNDIKDWIDESEKNRRCGRCKTKKSDKKYKNSNINYCMCCSLKKNRLYGRILSGLEERNKRRRIYEKNDITNLDKINCCNV